MVKDFTVLKGVYMILHEVPWAFINDNLFLDKCYGESKRTLGEWMDFSKEHDHDD